MDKKAVLIIKPDFINKRGMNIIKDELAEASLKDSIDNIYRIPSFREFSIKQRELEMAASDMTDETSATRMRDMQFTIEAYKQEFVDFGLAIVLSDNNLGEEGLYNAARKLKHDIREKYIRSRPTATFVVLQDEKYTIMQRNIEEMDALRERYGEALGFAHFNGVHLEDYDEYQRQVDYNICSELGIISPANEVRIKGLSKDMDESERH